MNSFAKRSSLDHFRPFLHHFMPYSGILKMLRNNIQIPAYLDSWLIQAHYVSARQAYPRHIHYGIFAHTRVYFGRFRHIQNPGTVAAYHPCQIVRHVIHSIHATHINMLLNPPTLPTEAPRPHHPHKHVNISTLPMRLHSHQGVVDQKKYIYMVEVDVNGQHFVSHALSPQSFSREQDLFSYQFIRVTFDQCIRQLQKMSPFNVKFIC